QLELAAALHPQRRDWVEGRGLRVGRRQRRGRLGNRQGGGRQQSEQHQKESTRVHGVGSGLRGREGCGKKASRRDEGAFFSLIIVGRPLSGKEKSSDPCDQQDGMTCLTNSGRHTAANRVI